MKILLSFASATVLLAPGACDAHAKWFCAYDTAVPPLPLKDVITPVFLTVAVGFSALMFLFYFLDNVVERNGWFRRIELTLVRSQPIIELLVRATVGAFFVSLWTSGGIILTPELKTTNGWIPWLQLVIAVSVLFRPTLVVTATGIVGLYAYAVSVYGAFHMMDYPIFLGLAAYLGCSAFDHPWLLRLRLPALYFNLALTIMWGAIEKFGYPYWTVPLLAAHRDLTLGLPFNWFMDIAGFVEFSLAFFMLTGTALLRLSCVVLMLLLASAVPEFGKIDAVGHALFIAGLAAMVIAGQNGIQPLAVPHRGGVFARTSMMTLTYGATIALLFGFYYGSQYVAGR
jgi:hypothetical protein